MTTASSAVVPDPTVVTPELLAQHSITREEYERILAALGRVPSLTELGIYSDGRSRIGEAHHSERVEQAEERGQERDQQGHLERPVPRVTIDADDLVLDRGRLAFRAAP